MPATMIFQSLRISVGTLEVNESSVVTIELRSTEELPEAVVIDDSMLEESACVLLKRSAQLLASPPLAAEVVADESDPPVVELPFSDEPPHAAPTSTSVAINSAANAAPFFDVRMSFPPWGLETPSAYGTI